MSYPELIDSHCHLNHAYGSKTTADLVREAGEVGVSTLMAIATEASAFEQVQGFSEAFPNVFHTVGVHPHEATTITEADMDAIRSAAKHPKCRGIGEIGLDYYYDHSPREEQIKWFDRQLELALELKMPVVVHSRDAEADLLASLKRYAPRVSAGVVPGVIHCFTGTQEFGQACLDLGFYISFSGILTFSNAEALRKCAREFPLDRLMVETDAPYLAPIPHRGKKCEPHMVRFTAMKLAEVRGQTLDEIALSTTRNTRQIFKLS